jgi:ubiquinone/menaquinone biosynthesis C-methylase UbiE
MAEKFEAQALDEFEKWSQDYDRPGFFQRNLFIPTEDHIIAEMISLEKADSTFKLLDIGCGTGKLVLRLHQKFPMATLSGVDISPGMIKVAASKVPNKRNLSFQVGNASSGLPYPERHFDYVTCCHSFHHYPDQEAAVKEFVRLLKPGGKMLFVDGDINSVWGYVMHRIIIGTYEKYQVKHHRAAALKAFFEGHGLRVVRQDRRGSWVPWIMTVAIAVT